MHPGLVVVDFMTTRGRTALRNPKAGLTEVAKDIELTLGLPVTTRAFGLPGAPEIPTPSGSSVADAIASWIAGSDAAPSNSPDVSHRWIREEAAAWRAAIQPSGAHR
jgi:hypothetical protein